MTDPGPPVKDNSDCAQSQSRILQYWRAIELFSPQKIPAVKPNSRSNPTLRIGGRTPVPWDSSHWFQEPDAEKEWRFTAYCGVYKQGRVRSLLEHHFGRNATDFDRRTHGESCLFSVQITAGGRALLDTFTLASCAWAGGRLHDPGPASRSWLEGFEAASQEQTLAFAERFAVLENDEFGRKLNSKPGVHVSRPIQPGDLEAEVEHLSSVLHVSQALQPKDIRIEARQVRKENAYTTESADFLNSFFLMDLLRLAEEAMRNSLSRPLALYLTEETALDKEKRRDVRRSLDDLWQNTSPRFVPAGRWPVASGQSLYFSQQFAVNSIFREVTGSTPLLGVNGPPGTGKTTLLREVIASVVVERANALSALSRPQDAFDGGSIHWQTSRYKGFVHTWRESLRGFGMVVASSNNRAVENITLEVPARQAISDEYLSQIDYFRDFATRILNRSERKSKQHAPEAWGLIAARLGNKKNRQRFVSDFYFADNEIDDPKQRSEQGFLRYLKTVKAKPGAWEDAVERFNEAVREESEIRAERLGAWEAIESITKLVKQVASLQTELRDCKDLVAGTEEDLIIHSRLRAISKQRFDKSKEALTEHLKFKPGLVDAIFTLGKAYQEWRTPYLHLAATVESERQNDDRLFVQSNLHEKKLNLAKERVKAIAAEIERVETQLAEQQRAQRSMQEKLGHAYPAVDEWLSAPDKRELSSPWTDELWNKARTTVFVEALHLHRTFIECVPKKVQTNLSAAMDILRGKVSPEVHPEGLQAAWETLFFVVPVVSSTFASFDRLFAHLGRESLGWLLIDEAGQAVPQAAAGALWRCKRAISVGDPLQLEPIVTLPFTAQQALRAHFEIEGTWLPSKNSVQTLADRVSRFGTLLHYETDEEPTWVGSPLRVHRRCENPMFLIANKIAYNNQMVYATQELSSSLPASKWIDTKSSESDEHWIPAEGLALHVLLRELFFSGASASDILLVSPFRTIARRLKEIGERFGIAQAGTIHVSQGKESEIVILVLGGDPRKLGAKEWASERPNLLNVAVSRARRRLFIIGNREEWSGYRYFSDASFLLEKTGEKLRAAVTLSGWGTGTGTDS